MVANIKRERSHLIIIPQIRFLQTNLLHAIIQILSEYCFVAVARAICDDMNFVDNFTSAPLFVDFRFD